MAPEITRQAEPVENQLGTDRFRLDALTGLRQSQKVIPSKYLYDEYGSQLFDQITELDEYYPTRSEMAIMREHVQEMARQLGPGCLLIEYGSGNSAKTRTLLDHLPEPAGYVPIDISEEHLRRSADQLEGDYPELTILPIAVDFTRPFQVPDARAPVNRRVVYFPGSTLGNFSPGAARDLLSSIREVAGLNGALLIGVDLRKDVETVTAAYNDREGVTAAFNLNLLTRINRELGADFDLDQFDHRAQYNSDLDCIEMRLLSQRDQTVQIGDQRVEFRAGESILTERSYKYSQSAFEQLARSAGLDVTNVWKDDRDFFSVQYLTVRQSCG